MPIREYRVVGTGEVIEEILDGDPPAELVSSLGRRAVLVRTSAIAATPGRWGDTPNSQQPYFDRGLGRWVRNEKHAAEVGRSLGLINLRELGDQTAQDNAVERIRSARQTRNAAEAAEHAEFTENLKKFDGDKELAVLETWSAARILNGQTIYAQE